MWKKHGTPCRSSHSWRCPALWGFITPVGNPPCSCSPRWLFLHAQPCPALHVKSLPLFTLPHSHTLSPCLLTTGHTHSAVWFTALAPWRAQRVQSKHGVKTHHTHHTIHNLTGCQYKHEGLYPWTHVFTSASMTLVSCFGPAGCLL